MRKIVVFYILPNFSTLTFFYHLKFRTFGRQLLADRARSHPIFGGIGDCVSPLCKPFCLNCRCVRGCVSFVLNCKQFHTHAAPTSVRPCERVFSFPRGFRHASLPAILFIRSGKAKHKRISLTFSGAVFGRGSAFVQGRTALARLDFSVAAFGLRHKSSTACTPSV